MLTFNGIDLTPYLVVKNIRRSVKAAQQRVGINIPNRDGSVFVRKDVGDIILVVEVTIIGSSRENYLENVEIVSQALDVSEPVLIQLYDEPYRNYKGILDGTTDLTTIHSFGTAILNFVCEPYKYGEYKTSITNTILNNGTIPTADWRTTITFTGAGSDVTIAIGTNSLVINQAVVSTDILIVDFKLRTVKLNGTLIMDKVSLASDFFELPIGFSTLSVTGATHTKVTAHQELFR
jgi:predicted phage tail component-like protein